MFDIECYRSGFLSKNERNIEDTMEDQIYLLLGGNLGNRLENLSRAREVLLNQIGYIAAESSIYETAAWGVTNQPSFLNQVVQLSSDLPPSELLFQINQIEAVLGRQRHERWHARTIDIDILYYGNQIINSQRLTLPHPQLHNRRFTLIPLVELAPQLMHPILKKNNQTLLQECTDELEVNLFVVH